MTPALAGWILFGMLCVAALILMVLGAFHVMRAQRELRHNLARLEEKQRHIFQPERLAAAMERVSRDAQGANELMQRARLALSTITVAIRYCALAWRLVKLLS